MPRRYDGGGWDELHNRIIGLGERSVRKSHYPELQSKINELEEQRRMLNTLLANLPGAAFRVAYDSFKVEFLSHGIRELTGHEPNAFLEGNVSFQKVVHPDDFPLMRAAVMRGLTTGQPYDIEYRFLCNGSIRWVWEQGMGVADDKGKVIAIEGFITDITERVEATRKLNELNEHLEQRVKEATTEQVRQHKALLQQSKLASMGEMIGAIAHQWRQPLTAVSLLIQELRDAFHYGELTKEHMDYGVDEALDLVGFMSKTIDDFRNFFRPVDEQERLFLSDVMNRLLKIVASQFKHNSIRLNVTDTRSEEEPVANLPSEFIQVMLNLLVNAKDAVDQLREESKSAVFAWGEVNVTISKQQGETVIVVEDNGGGVPVEILDRIFEPYFTTKLDQNGTGVGLYMVKTILANMGGTVACENTGNGARFTVRYPTV